MVKDFIYHAKNTLTLEECKSLIHFYESNEALQFERESSKGWRLNIPAGTAVRFEPGQAREVELIPFEGKKIVFGFNAKVQGKV